MVSVRRAKLRRKSEEIVSVVSALVVWVVASHMSLRRLVLMTALDPAAALGLVLRSWIKLSCKNHCSLECGDMAVVGAKAR